MEEEATAEESQGKVEGLKTERGISVGEEEVGRRWKRCRVEQEKVEGDLDFKCGPHV